MAYTYQFEDHLREHRPSRLGQRMWWMPVGAAVAVVIADAIYLALTSSGRPSVALAAVLPLIAALLVFIGWGALSIADWTFPAEKHYREAQHAAERRARAYILAGGRSRDQHPPLGDDVPTARPAGRGPGGGRLKKGEEEAQPEQSTGR